MYVVDVAALVGDCEREKNVFSFYLYTSSSMQTAHTESMDNHQRQYII